MSALPNPPLAWQHASEQRLADSLLGTVFDVAQVGIFCIDTAGIFVRVNPAFCELTGYSQEEIEGQPYTLIAPLDILPIADKFLAALLHDSKRMPKEWRIRRKDQSHFDVLVSHKAVVGQSASQTTSTTSTSPSARFAVVTFTDISARLEAEAQAQGLRVELEQRVTARTEELAEMLTRYQAIAENTREAIFVVSRGKVAFANARVARALGTTRERVLGMSAIEIAYPEHRAEMIRLSQAILRDEPVPVMEYPFVQAGRTAQSLATDPQWSEMRGTKVIWDGAAAILWCGHDITERKRLQQKLEATAAEREAILETSAVGICLLNNRRHRWVNGTMSRILGYSSAELIGQETSMHYADAEVFATLGQQAYEAIARVGTWTGEAQMRRKDGSLVWVQMHGRMVSRALDQSPKNEAGQASSEDDAQSTVWTYVDITERKLMTESLARSENKYRQVVERASEAILVGSRERGILYFNAKFLALNRLSEDEARGMALMELVIPEDRPILMEAMGKRLSPEGRRRTWPPIEIRTRFSTPEAPCWHAINGVPVMWEDAPSILMFANDVTERKRLQEDVRQAFAHRDSILKTTSVGICYFANRRFTWVNDAVMQMTGYTYEEMLGNDASFVYADPADYARIGSEGYPQIFSVGSYDLECQLLCADGSRLWTRLTGRAINRERAADGTIWTVVDLSAEKKAEKDMLIALDKARELSELKTRFVSMTSHEFRTPLATILSSAELLEHYSDKFDAQEKLELLREIQVATKRMGRMLEDVLTIGKVDAGRMEFDPQALNLDDFCRKMLAEVGMVAGAAHRMRFELGCDPALFARGAKLDEKLVRHIVTNLLTNACKYTPAGGLVTLQLAQSPLDAPAKVMTLTVSDSGIGIPTDDQPRLFESFHRAHNVGNIPGTGLGLAIVKRSVDLHGGTIAVTSAEGQGSTFTVQLPFSD